MMSTGLLSGNADASASGAVPSRNTTADCAVRIEMTSSGFSKTRVP